jgi:hypothetical protein
VRVCMMRYLPHASQAAATADDMTRDMVHAARSPSRAMCSLPPREMRRDEKNMCARDVAEHDAEGGAPPLQLMS